MRLPTPLMIVIPGLLVAATGVGAGDLAGGAFAGSKLGVAILWAILLGAALKFILSEGLARWQLATGTTLLEGMCQHLGWPAKLLFIIYLSFWSLWVGLALISACGVATHALIPVFDEATTGKIVWGITHSLLGLVLVWFGSYRFFESMMALCVAIMFVVIIVVAAMVGGDWGAIAKGLSVPTIPAYVNTEGEDQSVAWTLTLLGGVGGTLTILCYGYWIRENGREGLQHLHTCRIDLSVAYIATALFGVAMVIIAANANLPPGKGASLIVHLANYLRDQSGDTVASVFLIGAWAAVFSSLLGVWQSVPYLFTDFLHNLNSKKEEKEEQATTDTASPAVPDYRKRPSYRAWLLALALLPLLGLSVDFAFIQKTYGVLGSLLIPLLSIVLLLLGRRSETGAGKTGLFGLIGLGACIIIYSWIGLPAFWSKIFSW